MKSTLEGIPRRQQARGQITETNSATDPNHEQNLAAAIRETARVWRRHHLSYDQTKYVVEKARRQMGLTAPGQHNGSYQPDLITPLGKIEQLRIPRDRDGTFTKRVFEEYHRSTGEVEDAVLEMWLQGISQRKIAQVTEKLGAVKLVRTRLVGLPSDWRYLKVNWGSHGGDLALLVAVGVNASGFREVLVVETFASEKTEAYRSLLKGLLGRGLSGVCLVVSDDHEAIKKAVAMELPGVIWQRCVVHFMRNVLSKVPAAETGRVAGDLKGIFCVNRKEDALRLFAAFCERYERRFPGAVATNGLERLFGEVQRRTRVIRVFTNEGTAGCLCSVVVQRGGAAWWCSAVRRSGRCAGTWTWDRFRHGKRKEIQAEKGESKPTILETLPKPLPRSFG